MIIIRIIIILSIAQVCLLKEFFPAIVTKSLLIGGCSEMKPGGGYDALMLMVYPEHISVCLIGIFIKMAPVINLEKSS